ncbi:MAG: MBL fold metallo-hydrolase [Candidatus Gastranaerophilales bacterium]|nr:MBL fold metallo-hydrolase [Candidatus Gastranaerophilales bacterium]
MKLTVLTDDNIGKSRRLLAEHGLCFYIEDEAKKILFDTGYSDVFIKNAVSLGINLLDLDYIVLSHGHYDHTWGLNHYLEFYISAFDQKQKVKKPTIITHPDTFLEKYEEGLGEIGCILTEEKLKKVFNVITTDEAYSLTENLTFLGEIPRFNDFEAKEPVEKVLRNGKYENDYVIEDSVLVYKSDKGLSIITGCSHSGICNIVEYSQKLFKTTKMENIIGGLHLIDTPKEKMNKIIEYLKKQDIKELYPCHCTDFSAKIELTRKLNAKNIGVGFKLEFYK